MKKSDKEMSRAANGVETDVNPLFLSEALNSRQHSDDLMHVEISLQHWTQRIHSIKVCAAVQYICLFRDVARFHHRALGVTQRRRRQLAASRESLRQHSGNTGVRWSWAG